jgi:H+/Cl- antiporter ClcA
LYCTAGQRELHVHEIRVSSSDTPSVRQPLLALVACALVLVLARGSGLSGPTLLIGTALGLAGGSLAALRATHTMGSRLAVALLGVMALAALAAERAWTPLSVVHFGSAYGLSAATGALLVRSIRAWSARSRR